MKKIIYLFLLVTTMAFADATENLFNAVKKIDVVNVKSAIENNANVNAKDSLGNTPLDYLINDYNLETESLKDINVVNTDMEKKYEIAKLLIKEDANINITKVFKDRVLFYLIIKTSLADIQFDEDIEKQKLALNADINFFNLILDTGVDLNHINMSVDNGQLNLLDYAIIRIYSINSELKIKTKLHGLEKIIQVLIDKNLIVSENFRPILLNCAVDLDNQKIVTAMLNLDIDVNTMIDDEFPTYIAAKNNSVKMLKFLESNGGYLDGMNNKKETPLSVAVDNSSLAAVKYLLENGVNPNQVSDDKLYLLMKAIKYADQPENEVGKEIVKILLKNEDINVNCKIDIPIDYFDNGYAFSPLSVCKDLEILELLIDKGADVNMKSNIGSTAIMNTVDTNKVDFLLKNGANINEVDNNNNNALTNLLRLLEDGIAEEDLDTAISTLKLLIEKGIDIKVIDNNGYDAFLYAVELNLNDVTKLLIEKGTDIKRKNKEGQNALIICSKVGNYEIAKLLIEKGLKVNTVDNEGITPLIEAVSAGKIELVKLLIEKGADVNAKKASGQTALQISKACENIEITDLLIKSGAK